jgi:hypothetical protein
MLGMLDLSQTHTTLYACKKMWVFHGLEILGYGIKKVLSHFMLMMRMQVRPLFNPPEFTQLVDIPASTLSAQFPNERIRLLKLEAEGAEPEVLEGAISVLNSIDYVSADVGPERGIHEQETRDTVVNFLEAHGFELIKESKGHRKIVLLRRKGLSEKPDS